MSAGDVVVVVIVFLLAMFTPVGLACAINTWCTRRRQARCRAEELCRHVREVRQRSDSRGGPPAEVRISAPPGRSQPHCRSERHRFWRTAS